MTHRICEVSYWSLHFWNKVVQDLTLLFLVFSICFAFFSILSQQNRKYVLRDYGLLNVIVPNCWNHFDHLLHLLCILKILIKIIINSIRLDTIISLYNIFKINVKYFFTRDNIDKPCNLISYYFRVNRSFIIIPSITSSTPIYNYDINVILKDMKKLKKKKKVTT